MNKRQIAVSKNRPDVAERATTRIVSLASKTNRYAEYRFGQPAVDVYTARTR